MAKNMNESVTSMRKIIKNNLKLLTYKYKVRKRQYFTKAKFPLKDLKAGMAEQKFIFSDEKLFTI